MNMRRKFEEVDRSCNKGLTPVKCPSCVNTFGLNDEFLRNMEDIIFVFTCPYCGKQHSLKKI